MYIMKMMQHPSPVPPDLPLSCLFVSVLQMETRKRLAKIVLVFVGLFALCWFPNHVLYMYRSFHYQQMDLSLAHLVITLVSRVLSFSSSCVNPFALYLLSESFRRHFNRLDLVSSRVSGSRFNL